MTLLPSEYLQLSREAGHIGGYVSCLRSLQSTRLPVERIREICNDIYNNVDSFLLTVEKLENKAKRRETKECTSRTK